MKTFASVILDELVDRWLRKVATLVALYVTFRGHNAPGGGFAGGLILGSVFVLEYFTGRGVELAGRPVRRPEAFLGVGLLLALVTTIAPLFVGGSPLESHIWNLDVPTIGEVKVVSSMFFDLGVFTVVVSVVLMILDALGTRGSAVSHERGGSVS
jgi:multicomponent Na+:H+ antiporter subunit A